MYQYLVKVGVKLVSEREKMGQLFKRMQLGFSELFYFTRLLFAECKDLELLKDYFRMQIVELKQ